MSTTLDERFIGKTYSDFLFRPQRGVVTTRAGISLGCKLTETLSLGLPVVSSNMDSVTGAEMARAMAMEGGLGVVHRAMTIERQAAKVAQIKRSQSAVIENPFCLPLGTTIKQAINFARINGITGILKPNRVAVSLPVYCPSVICPGPVIRTNDRWKIL